MDVTVLSSQTARSVDGLGSEFAVAPRLPSGLQFRSEGARARGGAAATGWCGLMRSPAAGRTPGTPSLPPRTGSAATADSDQLLVVADGRAGNRGALAFGSGAHACRGPALARILSETPLERVPERLPGLDVVVPGSEVRNRPGTLPAELAEPAELAALPYFPPRTGPTSVVPLRKATP